MSDANSASSLSDSSGHDKLLFWACFVALVATAFGFFVRGALLDEWGDQFGLNSVRKGQIQGIGIWPMGVSIVLFSLIIDKIGYGKAMLFAFCAHIAYAVIVICAPMVLAPEGSTPEAIDAGQEKGYWLLYIGNLIFALGNGTVEAVINPVVATMFSRSKTKWLNILHAGWPGGLVFAGLMVIGMGDMDWRLKVGLIFIPVIAYGLMMLPCKFPVQERVAAGSSYREMLGELGIVGALIVIALIVREMLGNVFGFPWWVQLAVGGATLVAFGSYARSLGRPMLIFLMLIMIPLATAELGTDGWITSLMAPQMQEIGLHAAWLLVYTSFIMMVLRFFAGSIVHRISPLGLLAVSTIVAALGLVFLSQAEQMWILVAATLYGFGKTFFWPTMLGVVAERFPKGGALTLNATGGVGMLGVGVLGFPFIGLLQEHEVEKRTDAAVYAQISEKKDSVFGEYQAVDSKKVEALTPKVVEAGKARDKAAETLKDDTGKTASSSAIDEALKSNQDYQNLIVTKDFKSQKVVADELEKNTNEAKRSALKFMAIFPCVMLVCYLILIAYFKAKGGYTAEVLAGHAAEDGKFTGGVEGPSE